MDPWSFETDRPSPTWIQVGCKRLRRGDRVRLRPKSRSDVMDMALEGLTAHIEAIEQDFDNRLHVAVTVDQDPGRDMGLLRQTGHRFFFAPDELEPLADEVGDGT